ncbi:MAG: glycosyltransferase family 4 protein, partial [Bacillota bacterium]|nr:glycosyltransferase family 4 protein [Bacillota bacterium]
IEIKRLKYLQLNRSNFFGRLANYFSFTLAVALRFGYLRNFKSVIVYSNPPVLPLITTIANRIFNTKIIFVSYDVYPEIAYLTNSISEKSIISKIMILINKGVFKNVNKVVALSHEMKMYLLTHRPTLSEQQIVVIPNWYEDKGICSSLYTSNNKLFNSVSKSKKLIVSYFGNMGICQDLDTIVNSIRQFKDDYEVKFIFAGHGKKMDKLKTLVEEEKLDNVKIFDFLHGQDFQDALNISDCFLVSLAEGLTGLCVPSKTYSYMMAGKPVIAIMGEESDIVRDLRENNAGYAMQVGETSKLVNAIKELRDDNSKRTMMGLNCRNLFLRKYKKEHCTQKYIELMTRILEAK